MNGTIQTLTAKERPIIASALKPIIYTYNLKANIGSFEIGQVIMKDANGDLVAYVVDPANAPFGVLTEKIDTSVKTAVNILRFGAVVKDNLLINNSSISDDDMEELIKINIYPV